MLPALTVNEWGGRVAGNIAVPLIRCDLQNIINSGDQCQVSLGCLGGDTHGSAWQRQIKSYTGMWTSVRGDSDCWIFKCVICKTWQIIENSTCLSSTTRCASKWSLVSFLVDFYLLWIEAPNVIAQIVIIQSICYFFPSFEWIRVKSTTKYAQLISFLCLLNLT